MRAAAPRPLTHIWVFCLAEKRKNEKKPFSPRFLSSIPPKTHISPLNFCHFAVFPRGFHSILILIYEYINIYKYTIAYCDTMVESQYRITAPKRKTEPMYIISLALPEKMLNAIDAAISEMGTGCTRQGFIRGLVADKLR